MNRKFFAVAILATLAALPLSAETFSIDPAHSEVGFTIRHLVSNVRGRFNDFSGKINMDTKNLPASSVDFHVKATSIDTAVPDRDKHLRSADFFDVEKFPEISFKSKSIKATGKDSYAVTGAFTMHGVTKEITLPVTFNGTAKDPWGGQRAGFSTETTINRKDYGIVWNKALDSGGVLVGEKVELTLEIEAVKQAAQVAA